MSRLLVVVLASSCAGLGCAEESGAGATLSSGAGGSGGRGGASSASGGPSGSVQEACEALNAVDAAIAEAQRCAVQPTSCDSRPAKCAAELIAVLDCLAENHNVESCPCVGGGQGGGPASGELDCEDGACLGPIDALAVCNG